MVLRHDWLRPTDSLPYTRSHLEDARMITFTRGSRADIHQDLHCFACRVGDTYVSQCGRYMYLTLHAGSMIVFDTNTGSITEGTVASVQVKVRPCNWEVKVLA